MDIKKREEKIKEKRRNTSFRDFVKEVASQQSLVFYKNQGTISRYPDTNRIGKILSFGEFSVQRDTLTKYGRDRDSSRSFFKQFHELFLSVPMAESTLFGNNENIICGNDILDSKNVYLSSGVVVDCENVLYSHNVKESSKDVYNSVMVWNNSENICFSMGILESSMIFYSKYIKNSYNIWFSENLVGCQNCISCSDLENQSYCIQNKKYTKEEYLEKKEEILREKDRFIDYYKELKEPGKNYGSINVKGVFVQDSQDVENGYMSYQIKKGRNIVLRGGKGVNEDVYDVITGGTLGNNDIYAVHGAGAGSQNVYCSCHIVSSNIYYSYFLHNCSYCLGCVGLINKQFCIFNKEYSKEERLKLANKIFEQMDKEGILGEFFPAWINPYYFNDTVAYLLDDSFTKEDVTREGYLRRDEEIKVDIPEGTDVIGTKDLSIYQGFDVEGNRKIDPEILKKVIKDKQGNYYRIVPMEYDFLIKHGLPLPELHWLERKKLGFTFK